MKIILDQAKILVSERTRLSISFPLRPIWLILHISDHTKTLLMSIYILTTKSYLVNQTERFG